MTTRLARASTAVSRAVLGLALAFVLAAHARAGENELAQRYFALGNAAVAAGKPDEARAHFARVLEREPKHLATLVALARLERTAQRTDDALDYTGRFLGLWRYLKEKPSDLAAAQRELAAYALEADPLRKRYDALRRDYVTKLLKLAGEQMDNVSWHSARAMLLEATATDADHPELAAGLARIKLEGGNELAVADEGGGVDPLAGVSAEWVEQQDPLHAEWSKAWELSTEHYKIKTNAGYRVLKTVARAMEQVQVFYRIFHQYKTDGGSIPVANVLIFKNAEEYKTLGNQPVEWAGGHWDGTNVVTYDARNGGEGGLAGMLDTLFHEASHQFTSLCGGGAVPAWLNEGMASFFEGTKLLSNGKLDWNLTVPGRLYPLVDDLKGKSPHKLADVLSGQIEDYRVNYPWGWGIVYYLYNAEDAQGRLAYRPLMREYFQEYHSDDHVERFTEFFVTRAKVEGIATLADFEKRFREYVLDLEAQDKGTVDAGRRHEERGDAQAKAGDWQRAVELYERALRKDPDYPEVLWKLAGALEKIDGQGDRAAGELRRWLTLTQVPPGAPDPLAQRRAEALARIAKLDTSAKRLASLRTQFHGDALALALDYDKRKFPRMALVVLRGPASAQPPSMEAREAYFRIADASGVSLEQWRLLFDERTLAGFYGGGEGDFRVDDGAIIAKIGADADNAKKPEAPSTGSGGRAGESAKASADTFAFRRLFVDARPAGDWSLSAEVSLEDTGRLAGLCFGKKADGLFHGVALLPEGYVDLGRFGANGSTLTRVKRELSKGWHLLRIDVAGTRLVARVDGQPALEWEFGSRAELAGDFGLLAGVGESRFREVKMLEFDPNLPRREKIGRRRAAAAVDASGDAPAQLVRAEPGKPAYANDAPPLLTVEGWIGDAPEKGDLDRLRGWPCLLVFWTTVQESRVPQIPGLVKLREKHAALDIPIVLLSNEKRETIEAYVKDHPVPFPIGWDWSQKLFSAYAIPTVQLPHAKLLDLEGKVVWEGNPDYNVEYGTYVDEPLADLVAKSKLAELKAAAPEVDEGERALAKGDVAAAIERLKPVAALDVPHPFVARAKKGLAAIEVLGEEALARADAFVKGNRVLQAAKVLEATSARFAGVASGDAAKKAGEKLAASKAFKNAKPLDNRLRGAEKMLAQNKVAPAVESVTTTKEKLAADGDPWLLERAAFLLDGAKTAKDGKELLARYRERFAELALDE